VEVVEFDSDITRDIRQALQAQGFTPSSLGTTETFNQLVSIILDRVSTGGGSYSALTQEVEEAVEWARNAGIYPLPSAYLKPTVIPDRTAIQVGPGGGRTMITVTQEQLDQAIDGEAFASLVPSNLTAAATAAMGALAFAASRQGLRYLALTPLFLNRFGVAVGTLEVIDLLTPGTDIPTVSDIPGWVADLIRGSGATVINEDGSEISTVERVLNFLLPGDPFGGNGSNPFTVGQVFMQNQIVKTWEANGVWFARQADGLNWVQRKNGTIKSFRNVRPIVLTSSGASTPKIAERALKALYGQYKSLKKAFKPFDKPAPRRAPARREWTGDNVTQIRN
jgi:hypothetical protein